MKKILLCLCLLFAYSVADEANKSYRLRSDRVINNNTKNDNVKNDIVTNKKNTTNKNTINKNVKSNIVAKENLTKNIAKENLTKNITISDKNGVFMGIELIGVSEIDLDINIDNYRLFKDKSTGIMFGLNLGYRHFFTDLIGLQGYFSVKDTFFVMGVPKSNTYSYGTTLDTNPWISQRSLDVLSSSDQFLQIMANIDVIFDFHKTKNFSFDAIAGIGLGMGMFISQTYINIWDLYWSLPNYSALYSDARVGLGMKGTNNRVGLNISFPIYPATKTIDGIKYQTKQNYAISLSYDYKF